VVEANESGSESEGLESTGCGACNSSDRCKDCVNRVIGDDGTEGGVEDEVDVLCGA